MKNMPLLFLGIFFCLAFSWSGIVWKNNKDLSYENLSPDNYTVNGEPGAIPKISGDAARGKKVYIDLGCIYCHSQQTRRKGFGADYERAWGNRQSVARDYVRQDRVLLGTSRTGPDLLTIGDRNADEVWHYRHLYDPQLTSEGSVMPSFKFLFKYQKIVGEPSADAVSITGPEAAAEGWEYVPTQRCKDLVAYLKSLKLDYDLPESQRVE